MSKIFEEYFIRKITFSRPQKRRLLNRLEENYSNLLWKKKKKIFFRKKIIQQESQIE